MKKSSIIFCIFALALIIAGAILCFVGKSKGDVFDNSVLTDEDYVKKTDITSALNYIVVDYQNVTINVYGNAQSDYIETINVDDSQINTSKSTGYTVSDSSDYLSMVYDTVTNFNGIRNILFPGRSHSGQKTVNIYLSGNYNITQLNFKIENGDVNIYDLDSNTDYNINISGNGNALLERVRTKSNTQINIAMGNVTLKDVSCTLLNGSIHTGNFHCYEENPGKHYYDMSCENGMVYLLEESQGNSFVIDDSANTAKIQFGVKNGNIHINQSENTQNP